MPLSFFRQAFVFRFCHFFSESHESHEGQGLEELNKLKGVTAP
jgi:hypothetical protein